MGMNGRVKAILFDAGNTLVYKWFKGLDQGTAGAHHLAHRQVQHGRVTGQITDRQHRVRSGDRR